MKARGFTMIELLVVIAIIGVLSALAIASLSTARAKGKDTAVKGDLGTIARSAAQYFDIGNTYGGSASDCAASGTMFNDTNTTAEDVIGNAIRDAQAKSSSVVCRVSSSAYMVAAQLSGGTWWCVDNRATQVEVSNAPSSTACN